ncbi:hypothetical protein [Alkalihalobacterium elongatum]|uniref:hypothetical protein n=1 Tax=Alkalihalobacterium elongatum TaxID=2675466 RepID=UPI001C1FD47B|nr:hypothetical protein [Alkalihalobacterium elongatum]
MGLQPLTCQECVDQFLTTYQNIRNSGDSASSQLNQISSAIDNLQFCVFGGNGPVNEQQLIGCEQCVHLFITAARATIAAPFVPADLKLAALDGQRNLLFRCVFD